MNNYDAYKYARDMAWQFLIDNQISELPLNLSAICKNKGYCLLLDSKGVYLKENDRGTTFLKDDQWQIVLNLSDSVQVRRYTLAHELGHIYLKHSLHDGKFGRSFGIQRIPKTFEEYQAERIVLGYPKNMNNTIGERAEAAEQFKEDLERRTGLEVILWDERLSTVEAERILMDTGVRRENRKQYVDKMAAAVILQNYLDSQAHEGQTE